MFGEKMCVSPKREQPALEELVQPESRQKAACIHGLKLRLLRDHLMKRDVIAIGDLVIRTARIFIFIERQGRRECVVDPRGIAGLRRGNHIVSVRKRQVQQRVRNRTDIGASCIDRRPAV